MREKKGISLIVLVITIAVTIVLSASIILTLTNNNPIENAKKVAFETDMSALKEDLNTYVHKKIAENQGVYEVEELYADENSLVEDGVEQTGQNIKLVLPSINDKYLNKIKIIGGRLNYDDYSNMKEYSWAVEVFDGITADYDKAESDNGTAQIDTEFEDKLENLKIYGNSVQNGTPSTDNPVEIESVGDIKNKFDVNKWYEFLRSFSTKYVEKTEVDGTSCIYYSPRGGSNGKPYMSGQFKPQTQYILSFRAKGIVGTGVSTGFKFVYTDGTGSTIYVKNDSTWNSYTLKSNLGKTISHIETTYSYSQGCYFDENSIQLEEGNIATEYVAYGKYAIPITLTAVGKNLGTAKQVYSGLATESRYTETTLDGRECVGFIDNRGTQYTGINFKENTQYTFSFDYKQLVNSSEANNKNAVLLCIYYTDDSNESIKVSNSNEDVKWKHISYTSKANKTIKSIGTISYNYHFMNYIDINTFQIEEGNKETGYEPYKEKTIYIYLDEPLRKIGEYADYIDLKNKKVVRSIGETTLKGNENWWNYKNGDNYHTYACSLSGIQFGSAISNTFSSNVSSTINASNEAIYSLEKNYIYVSIAKNRLTADSANDFKAWVKSHNIVVDYVLINKKQESINIPEISTINGTNNISIGTSVNPSKMEVIYGK